MKNTWLYILLFGFISCENTTIEAEIISQDITELTPIHNSTSQFSIEGMTCEIGCVRTVKSHLSKMDGVLRIEMDFDTARTIDFSTVEYNNKIISAEEMQTEIESIANGLYTVTEIVETNH